MAIAGSCDTLTHSESMGSIAAEQKIEEDVSVVTADAYRTLEVQDDGDERALPNEDAVGLHGESLALEVSEESVGLIDLQWRWRGLHARLDVIDVSVVQALGMSALARVQLDGDGDFLGVEVPHYVDQVALILRLQLDAELMAHFAAAEVRDLFSGSQVGEMEGDFL